MNMSREERLRRVKELSENGMPVKDIAETLGVCEQTINKDRRKLGVGKRIDGETRAMRLERVKSLYREGVSNSDIAEILGVTARTVNRDKRALGLALTGQHDEIPDDALTFAKRLLEDGAGYEEAAQTVGCSRRQLKRLFPGHELPASDARQRARMFAVLRNIDPATWRDFNPRRSYI